MSKLSRTMRDAIAAIRLDASRQVRPTGGGFWETAGKRATFTTGTVYALTERGLLRRLNVRRESWRDTYELTDAADKL